MSHPPVLCCRAQKWHEMSILKLVDNFRTEFALAYAQPDRSVAKVACEYAEFFNAAVPVSLVKLWIYSRFWLVWWAVLDCNKRLIFFS
jgi:hypothetical protein